MARSFVNDRIDVDSVNGSNGDDYWVPYTPNAFIDAS
jgi:hypothetical protein